jgi:hypothetical protein
MQIATREMLSKTAREKALLPFHGFLADKDSNLHPIIALFPKWNIVEADRKWCAAFVYYCCVEAGFQIPYSPDECISCSLAGCGGWEDFALGDNRIKYYSHNDTQFTPSGGDVVLYDRVFMDCEHDHIGIVLENKASSIIVAEGNTFNDNISRVLERKKDEHIRAFIRIPDNYHYHGK